MLKMSSFDFTLYAPSAFLPSKYVLLIVSCSTNIIQLAYSNNRSFYNQNTIFLVLWNKQLNVYIWALFYPSSAS